MNLLSPNEVSASSSDTLADQQIRTGLMLFAHGSRDPQWSAPFEQLQRLWTMQQLIQPDASPIPCVTAYLERMSPTMQEAAQQLIGEQGCSKIIIAPIFLGQGGHLKEDITALVSELQTAYPQIQIERAIAAGQCDLVLQGIMRYLQQITQ